MIEFTYKLSKEDYFIYLLYRNQTSELNQKLKRKTHYLYPLLFLIMSIVAFFLIGDLKGSVFFLMLGAFWFILIPHITKWRINRYFDKYIDENYYDMINQSVDVIIDENDIFIKDSDSETRMSFKNISELIELKDYLFVNFNKSQMLILPKTFIPKLSEVKDVFINKNIPYKNMIEWKPE